MNKTNSAIRAWVGSGHSSVPSISEVRTSGQLITAEARKAAEFAKEKASKAGNLVLIVGVGAACWLVDDRLDGSPSPMSRVEMGVQTAVDLGKRVGGMVSSVITELDQATHSLENYVPPMMPVEHDITNLPKV